MGRLFDGVYAILTGRAHVTYEGQGAILLETMAEVNQDHYPVVLEASGDRMDWDFRPMVPGTGPGAGRRNGAGGPGGKVYEHRGGAGPGVQCQQIRERTGLHQVVLSGGVFQICTCFPGSFGAWRRRDLKCIIIPVCLPTMRGFPWGRP